MDYAIWSFTYSRPLQITHSTREWITNTIKVEFPGNSNMVITKYLLAFNYVVENIYEYKIVSNKLQLLKIQLFYN